MILVTVRELFFGISTAYFLVRPDEFDANSTAI